MFQGELISKLNEAESKAFKALAGYKFIMFGYWAAIWVHLNRMGKLKRNNPFKQLVNTARKPKSLPALITDNVKPLLKSK